MGDSPKPIDLWYNWQMSSSSRLKPVPLLLMVVPEKAILYADLASEYNISLQVLGKSGEIVYYKGETQQQIKVPSDKVLLEIKRSDPNLSPYFSAVDSLARVKGLALEEIR